MLSFCPAQCYVYRLFDGNTMCHCCLSSVSLQIFIFSFVLNFLPLSASIGSTDVYPGWECEVGIARRGPEKQFIAKISMVNCQYRCDKVERCAFIQMITRGDNYVQCYLYDTVYPVCIRLITSDHPNHILSMRISY